jgi:glycosyltransferase involved in cell wall biosynthesis
MARTKIVFLYTELAGYFLACVKELSKSADVLIVRWPVNKEAPFKFDADLPVEIVDRNQLPDHQLLQKVKEFDPGIIVCSGWMDKGYLRIVRSFKKKIACVLSLDNHWTGSLKQRLASLASPFFLRRMFTHAWVPGEPQFRFAKKLGFKHVIRNFYCADTHLFDQTFQATYPKKKEQFPHRFLYVGRYVEHKGIFELWEAFITLQQEYPNDWELWCLGTGEEWENRVEHEKIRHIGFVQPAEMEHYIAETSVYILPSKFEPWGVTVQEFAVCGFPLLLSDAIGSKEKFLDSNGYVFKRGSAAEIQHVMRQIINTPDDVLMEMGKESHRLGMALTPVEWAKNLLGLEPLL